ncbi:MAG: HEAT repeat domain-containing protein [Treponema sp.]|nr:HEAT repeat domain-containing protein [Treponema sp.]MCI6893014.1 HEAT repeat domain-containing protein [Treponema sp.]MCI7566094.1 HEAT repeat domain-containing protein [Treponema sp.]
MKLSKKVLISSLLAFLVSSVFAQESQVKKQNNNKEEETSVESEYLNDVDGDIIITLAESDDYDNKLVALQYLQSAIEDGNESDAIIQALDKLAGEGLTNQTRKNGRLTNNYPEIRRQACLLMAKVPTEHSKNTLVSIAVADNEPMVIAAAVKSLGEIGINENDEVIEAIAFANRRNQVLNPTSSLALEVLTAYETLADKTENKKTMIDSIARISSDYHYVTPVRQKAFKLLKSISATEDSKKKEDKKSNSKSDNTEVTGD